MGVIVQFSGGRKCRGCGQQIDPKLVRMEPQIVYCQVCYDIKAKVNENFAKSMRLTMDDIAKIMGYRTPQCHHDSAKARPASGPGGTEYTAPRPTRI